MKRALRSRRSRAHDRQRRLPKERLVFRRRSVAERHRTIWFRRRSVAEHHRTIWFRWRPIAERHRTVVFLRTTMMERDTPVPRPRECRLQHGRRVFSTRRPVTGRSLGWSRGAARARRANCSGDERRAEAVIARRITAAFSPRTGPGDRASYRAPTASR